MELLVNFCLGIVLARIYELRAPVPAPNSVTSVVGAAASLAPLKRTPLVWDLDNILGFLSNSFCKGILFIVQESSFLFQPFLQVLSESSVQRSRSLL